MPELILPDVRVHVSFLSAMAEFAEEGRTGDGSMVGNDIAAYADSWESAKGFAAFVALTRRDSEVARRADWVRCTSLWWVEDQDYLGRIAIRHDLGNDFLREVGGHIGYDVRRSRRREGHASAMLRAALPEARRLGIQRALVTCDDTNIASRKVIESAGGVLEDRRGGKLRYWVPTAP